MFRNIFDFKNQKVIMRWEIIMPVLFFIFISLIILSSTSNNDIFLKSTFYKQIVWLHIGCFFFILMQYVRIQYFYNYSYIFYLLLLLLILSTVFSPVIEGAQRWIVFGPIYFQPAEIGKIIYVICIARFFTDLKIKNNFTTYFIVLLILVLIPPLLVFRQPDLGTAMIYLSIIIPMLFWSGVNPVIIFLLISPFISILAVVNLAIFYFWMSIYIAFLFYFRPKIIISIISLIINLFFGLLSPYIWNNILKGHQKQRIITVLDPFSDPLGSGYQVIQSMISIGSGGLWGKGLGEGTQTHLKFLPVKDTDFIISVISEEMGFITIFLILIALLTFIYWCFNYASKIENKYSSLLLVGCSTIIFMHFIINMGMVSGLLPVTGLPVPFISYGGTFFITCSIMVGIINNIINNYI